MSAAAAESPGTVTRMPPRFARYVAIGDSSTEGLDDPAGDGRYRGWADRLAVHLARAQGDLLYANLAVRGRRTREILEQQLAPALAMRPELATVFSGTNDIIRSGFDLEAMMRDIGTMHRALRDAGATVLTFTMPDLSEVMPMARRVAPRLLAFNAAVRTLGAETGTIVVDLAHHPVAADPRLWSDDRLHANSLGHARIAAALAHALGLPGSDAGWHLALPPRPVPTLAQRVAAELRWAQRYFVPWVWRHARGRSSGDGIQPKRPALAPVNIPQDPDPTR